MPFIYEELLVLYVLPLILLCICILFAHYITTQNLPSITWTPYPTCMKPTAYDSCLGQTPDSPTHLSPAPVHYAPQPANTTPLSSVSPSDGNQCSPVANPNSPGMLPSTEERWLRLQEKARQRTQDLESAINSLSDFESGYNRLKKWLGEKERMTSVLGPVAVEPGVLRNQKLQVEVRCTGLQITGNLEGFS